MRPLHLFGAFVNKVVHDFTFLSVEFASLLNRSRPASPSCDGLTISEFLETKGLIVLHVDVSEFAGFPCIVDRECVRAAVSLVWSFHSSGDSPCHMLRCLSLPIFLL